MFITKDADPLEFLPCIQVDGLSEIKESQGLRRSRQVCQARGETMVENRYFFVSYAFIGNVYERHGFGNEFITTKGTYPNRFELNRVLLKNSSADSLCVISISEISEQDYNEAISKT